MANRCQSLFIAVSILVTVTTFHGLFRERFINSPYRMVAPLNWSASFERLKTNLTVKNIQQCDPKFLPDIDAMSKSGYSIGLENHSPKFTVLMRTFDRLNSIREAVGHYACMPSVDRVVLLWSNQNLVPPSVQFFNKTCPEKIVVKALPSANLTLRFSAFEEIRTDGT